MSDLAALNKSVSLSSASHDFVLLAKSLGRCPWWHFRDAAVGTDSPLDARARSPVGSEGSRERRCRCPTARHWRRTSKWLPDFLVASARFPHSRRFTTSVIFNRVPLADAGCHIDDRAGCRSGERTCGKVGQQRELSPAHNLETQKVAEFLVISVTSWRKRLRHPASACSATSCVVPAVLPSMPSSSH